MLAYQLTSPNPSLRLLGRGYAATPEESLKPHLPHPKYLHTCHRFQRDPAKGGGIPPRNTVNLQRTIASRAGTRFQFTAHLPIIDTMARALIYLTIFTLFAWSALVSITYALPPTHPNQELIPENVTGVAVALFIASSLTICLIISIAKSLLPNRKLPHLLIRDSLIYSSILGMGCTGLFMLQLLRSATLLNVGLWLAIIITTVWIIRSVRHTKAGDPTQANNYPMKRSPVLGKKLRRR